MKPGKNETFRQKVLHRHPGLCFALASSLALILVGCRDATPNAPNDAATTGSSAGAMPRHGGRLVASLADEPRTFNPVTIRDVASRTVTQRIMADLVHIDRQADEAIPRLAESWSVSDGGRRYELDLRPDLRFSDGHPLSVEDVVFSFQVYLDPEINSPERSQLIVEGQPIEVRKVDEYSVSVELASPIAAAERLFDGLAILPRHRLQTHYEDGTLREAWGLDTPPEEIVGLGPFRVASYVAGERLVLERNPHFWRFDEAGQQLPYLDELVFLFTTDSDAQAMRLLAGELDVVDRLSAEAFETLSAEGARGGLHLVDLGASLDTSFLFFNLNDLSGRGLSELVAKQRWFELSAFRQAIRQTIDRSSMSRLLYRGRAQPMASHEAPGNSRWAHRELPPPAFAPEEARQLLAAQRFTWDERGQLHDSEGDQVEFTILTAAGNPSRARMASLIQDDLRALGIAVRPVTLELGAMLQRVLSSFDYEACILGLGGGSSSPNRMMSLLLSNSSQHLWRIAREHPDTPWEAEVDRLMRLQLITLDVARRREIYDRVQEILAEQAPLIGLVSPNLLVAAKRELGNFKPSILEHHTLWNSEELFWQSARESTAGGSVAP